MKNRWIVGFLILLSFSGGISSCKNGGNNSDSVSTDLINNPITASGENVNQALPEFKFQFEDHDFGVIIQGEKVSYTFKYKNVGEADLLISNVSASCGCTVPTYDKRPVAPGEEGSVEVVFDSSGRSGKQRKTITVLSNAQPNTKKLIITGEIIIPNE